MPAGYILKSSDSLSGIGNFFNAFLEGCNFCGSYYNFFMICFFVISATTT